MLYQRKPFLKTKPRKPYDLIRTTAEGIWHADPCSLITTKANRDFLARLETAYRVSRKAIAKILCDTYDQEAVVTEIMAITGGNELGPQGEKIVKGYARAIGELQKLLKDETLDVGFHGTRPGRRVTTRDCIGEDVAHLEKQRREWASLYHVHPGLWADQRPVMTTALTNQVGALHSYISGCMSKTAEEGRRDCDRHGHDAAIYRLLSELLGKIYRHGAFDAKRKLSPRAIKGMVDNVVQHVPKGKYRGFTRRILGGA
jgi:hypothetical protein